MSYSFLLKKNNAKSKLSSAITINSGTLSVLSAAKFPTTGNFLVTLWNKAGFPDPGDDTSMEMVLVTSVTGTVFTITRAQCGTTAKAHAKNASVELLLTKEHFDELESQILLKAEKGDKGDQGEPGIAGSRWYSGSGVPVDELGVENDFYLDISNDDVYQKGVSSWDSPVANIKGAPGLAGSDGTNGTDGDDGREVELQVATGYIQWRYVGDVSWTNLVSLVSLTGPAGQDGTNGLDGSNGSDGREVLLQVSGGYIQWQYSGDMSWTNLVALADLKGEKGDDGYTPIKGVDYFDGNNGLDGAAGSRWYEDSGVPSDIVGIEHDFYLDITNGDVYEKGVATWGSSIGNIRGLQGIPGNDGTDGTDGADGLNGEDGNTWYSGSGVPSDGLGVNGDFYLNTATYDVYVKAGGTWGSPALNIKGAKGDTGDVGSINGYSPKSPVVDNDIILIEDSEATYAKKKVLLSVLKTYIGSSSSSDPQDGNSIIANQVLGG